MTTTSFIDPDDIRELFSRSLSTMYKDEVPQYGSLLEIVAQANSVVLRAGAVLEGQLRAGDHIERLGIERHGAIRLGTPKELENVRRMFSVMGMHPVGYYDLSVAGVPVHATAFRPTGEASLRRNPFRVFTSLLRLELIADSELRERAAEILSRREIFTPRCLELVALAERDGGLSSRRGQEFVDEALKTFIWHGEATVDLETYRHFMASHPVVADVVCFKGPHINHLTPRVLDIDRAHAAMAQGGIRVKEAIEGPPRRRYPILLRQTSFLALAERIRFQGKTPTEGAHTARFGEIEQRGCALTPKGRALYDELLAAAREDTEAGVSNAAALARAFEAFPDDDNALRREGLAFFRYAVSGAARDRGNWSWSPRSPDDLVEQGVLRADALLYEDFLPVSAAGIFRSNLGAEGLAKYAGGGNRFAFELALGTSVIDEISLYAAAQAASLERCRAELCGEILEQVKSCDAILTRAPGRSHL